MSTPPQLFDRLPREAKYITYLIKHSSIGLVMSLSSAAKLRSLLKSMEQDLRLSDLTEVQRDMYYACRLIAEESGEVTLSSLQTHELTAGVPRATYFRALAGLVELGRLVRVGSERSGLYRLSD